MNAGASEIAPPNSTANRSSAWAASMIWLLNTKRRPTPMLANTGARGPSARGSATRSHSSTAPAASASTAANA